MQWYRVLYIVLMKAFGAMSLAFNEKKKSSNKIDTMHTVEFMGADEHSISML